MLKKFRNNKIVRFLSNRYFIILLLFVIWMIFFDENSLLNHWELGKEIDNLEKSNEYYQDQIKQDKKVIDNLNDPDSLEKYAREEYKMKKENEDIFLIEYDTIEETNYIERIKALEKLVRKQPTVYLKVTVIPFDLDLMTIHIEDPKTGDTVLLKVEKHGIRFSVIGTRRHRILV